MKYIKITKGTNVWIKFLRFINDMWKKTVFEVFSSTGKYTGSIRVLVRISNF